MVQWCLCQILADLQMVKYIWGKHLFNFTHNIPVITYDIVNTITRDNMYIIIAYSEFWLVFLMD